MDSLEVQCLAYFLNEVLSLNAQEFATFKRCNTMSHILNEVLSLNAQESAVAGLA